MELFPAYTPFDRQDGLFEVMNLSGGRSSAFALKSLIKGGFGFHNEHLAIFENMGKEDETCYKFLHDIEINENIKIIWLEYTLTPKFITELVLPGFSYDKFNKCEYSSIEQILDVKKLRSFKFEKSKKSFWYKEKYSDPELSIKEVNYHTASRNGKPFCDLFLYKCAIRIMKSEGLLLPSVGQRWCTGDGKEKVVERWLSLHGIKEYISYKGMRFDEPDRVRKVKAKNDKQDKIWYDCPLDFLKITKKQVLDAWSQMHYDLGDIGTVNYFIDAKGNCTHCHLKKLIKKLWLIQQGIDALFFEQCETIANNYNGDIDAMSRQHGTYESIRIKAMTMPEISIQEVLSNEEIEISCFNCTD